MSLESLILVLLEHPEPVVRATAATMTEHPPGVRIAQALRDRALDDPSDLVRGSADRALREVGLLAGDRRWCAVVYDPDELAAAVELLVQGTSDERVAAAEHIARTPHISALPILIAALDPTDHKLNMWLLRALGKICHHSASSAVERLLFGPENEVSVLAASVLGTMPSPTSVEALRSILSSASDVELKSAAARALAEIGDESVSDVLITRTLDDPNASVRRQSIHALVSIGTRVSADIALVALRDRDGLVRGDAARLLRLCAPDQVGGALINVLRDRDHFVVVEAATSLGELGEDRAAEPLIALLRHREERVRGAALRALSEIARLSDALVLLEHAFRGPTEIHRKAAGHALRRFPPEAVSQQVLDGLTSLSAEIRQSAIWIVGEMRLREGAPTVLALSDDPVPKVRRAAVWTLAALRMPDAEDVALKLCADENLEVHWHALWALGEVGTRPEAYDALVDGLSKRADIRQRAAASLEPFGDPRASPRLIPLLRHRDASVRRAAVTTIGRLRGDGRAEVAHVLAHDADDDVRKRAAIALGRLRDRASLIALVLAARDPDAGVRAAVAQAMSEIGDPQAAPVVYPLLDDPVGSVRKAAVYALGLLDRRKECRSLIDKLHDVDLDVRLAACLMLAAGGGEKARRPLRQLQAEMTKRVQKLAAQGRSDRRLPRVRAAAIEALGAIDGRLDEGPAR